MRTVRCRGRLKGVSVQRGVCLLGVYLGGVCPGGTPPPLNRITGRCKNIIFPQLRLRTVITTTRCYRDNSDVAFSTTNENYSFWQLLHQEGFWIRLWSCFLPRWSDTTKPSWSVKTKCSLAVTFCGICLFGSDLPITNTKLIIENRHWRIPLHGPNSFVFMQFSPKILRNNRLVPHCELAASSRKSWIRHWQKILTLLILVPNQSLHIFSKTYSKPLNYSKSKFSREW